MRVSLKIDPPPLTNIFTIFMSKQKKTLAQTTTIF